MEKDQVVPKGLWEFSPEVTAVFDDMLERSIPQYAIMRDLCFKVAAPFIKPDTTILDVGCSRGEALVPFTVQYGSSNKYVGLEISESMLHAARTRFCELIEYGLVDIRKHNLKWDTVPDGNSVVLCVLSLMFTPIEYRAHILQELFNSLQPGGALILVEKVLGSTAATQDMFIEIYYDMKRENGYTQEQIDRKRLSLEGVQVCVSSQHNIDLLQSAGFKSVDCFWRWINFAGWVAVK